MTDTERIDLLEKFVINFRIPLYHGSQSYTWYSPPVDEEGDPTHTQTLREVMDDVISTGMKDI